MPAKPTAPPPVTPAPPITPPAASPVAPPRVLFTAQGEPVGFFDTAAAAAFLQLEPATLEKMRTEGGGPPFYTPTRRILYAVAELIAWATAHPYASNSERGNVPITHPPKAVKGGGR